MDKLIQQLNIALDKITRLESSLKKIEEDKKKTNDDLSRLRSVVEKHQHTDSDGTPKLRIGIETITESGGLSYIGNGGVGQVTSVNSDGTKNHSLFIAVGEDKGLSVSDAQESINSQLVLSQYGNGSGTFFYSASNPQYTNKGKSVSSGGSTLTDTNFNWSINVLAGAYVNIYDSVGSFQFTRQISSNTSSVITITGTWPSTVSNCTYSVFLPTYLGSADNPWKRGYVGEGTSEGLRFGYGPTNGGQNGLLYMDSSGNLYWRNKGGSSSLLNATISGASGSFTTTDGKTVTVSGGIVTSIV